MSAELEALLSTAQLSEKLGIPESTLRTWRANGEGPRFARIKGKVKYHPRDVQRWWDLQVKATQRGRSEAS